jgi:hypothetical protein
MARLQQCAAAELIDGNETEGCRFPQAVGGGWHEGNRVFDGSDDRLAQMIDPKARELAQAVRIGSDRRRTRELRKDRAREIRHGRYETLSRCDLHAADVVRNGQGLQRKRKARDSVHDTGRLVRSRRAIQTGVSYNLPPRWIEKKSSVDLSTPFNFVSDDDIIGGNSGSPTINKEGELIGLIFDGNIQSLVGNFYYDDSINRAISVDVRAMREVLRKIFGANEIADELSKG